MTPFVPKSAPQPRPPSGPTEFPLRLAQVLLPQGGGGRQPRWSSRFDPGLELQPTPFLGQPGLPAGAVPGMVPGLPPGMAPGLAPSVAPGMVPGIVPAAPGQGAELPLAAPTGEGPVSFQGIRPASGSGALPAVAEAEGGGRGIMGWAIPPIRWGGTIGYNLRHNSSDDGARSLDQVLNANLRGSSYIYAPWLATVSGNIGMVSGVNRFSGADGAGEVQSRNTSLVGGVNLDLFPASRFPFHANLIRSDSRVTGTALSNQYTETRLGLRQSYRSEDSLQNASAGFDHSTVATQSGLTDTVNAIHGSYSTPWGPVSNSANARASVSKRQGTGEGSRLLGFNTTHTYSADENLSLQAYSSYTDNELNYGVGSGSIGRFRGRFLQLGTSATWRPEFEDEEDYPLTLNAGLMYSDNRMGSGSGVSQSQRVTGNTSAFYRFSPNLTASGSGTVNYIPGTTGPSQVLALVNSSVSYNGDPLTIGNFSYNWNTGGNVSWQGGSGGSVPTNVLAGAQAGHSVGRNFILSGSDSVSLNLSQSVATYQSQLTGSTSTLSTSAMASYRLGLGERFNGTLNTTFSDIFATGINAQHYQSLMVGLNGLGQLSPRSSATANLVWNWSDQSQQNIFGASGQSNGNQRMTLNGNASYTHSRFANVPGLRYTMLFAADSLLRDNRLLGDPNAQAQRFRYSVDNRLEYRIGLLDLRLSAMVTELGGKKNALLFFQVTRQIGSY